MPASDTTFSRLYAAWRKGEAAAQEQIIQLVWRDLHRLARNLLRHEQQAHTLQPTLLTSEVCQRLLQTPDFTWQNRQHFFALAAHVMRQLLVNHARATQARKRLRYPDLIPLDEAGELPVAPNLDVLALHEALAQFAALDQRASQVVELRFFFGLTEKEIAQVLDVSLITVKRDWEVARLWLYRQLTPPSPASPTPAAAPEAE
ncbi:MAG: ECF-type sigma factor [Blastocatellia bacterium]